jgi:hypothetical protein
VRYVFIRGKKINFLEKEIVKLNKTLSESNLSELIFLMGNKKDIFIRNLIAGITKGIGIGIGITIITAIILFLLRRIVALNIPVIGDFIADIVSIVEQKR